MEYSDYQLSDVHCGKHPEYTLMCSACQFIWEQVKGANKRKKENTLNKKIEQKD